MSYIPQQAPANLDLDGLRRFVEDEFRNVARSFGSGGSGQVLFPETDFGAVGDGVTDDGPALQAWANALRDGGIGAVKSAAGYATAQTITFMPSTNVAPVQGPRIIGNLKLIGHASLPVDNDILRVWNPTAVSASQNFYSPQFDSIEVSNTTGLGSGVSLRGFWGHINQIRGTGVYDVVVFPNFLFGGIPDEYESICNIGDVTGINHRNYVINNAIGIAASPTAGNVRGTIPGIFAGQGCIFASGGENFTGNIAYTGIGPAVTIGFPPAPAIQTQPHEIFMQGGGDIDVAQYGFRIAQADLTIIHGHRMNIEPAGFVGVGPSWPLIAYSFGAAGNPGRLLDVVVHTYMTIRAGVTALTIGTLFDFNNDIQISNLVVYATILDQTGIFAGMAFNAKYKNINANATIKIVENGVLLYDTTQTCTVAQLPAAAAAFLGVRRVVSDSNTAVYNAVVAGGGAIKIGVFCNGGNWVVS